MHSGTCAPHRPPPSAQLFRGGVGGCGKTTFRNSFPIFPVAAVIGKTLWMALWLLPPPPPDAVNWNHVLIDEEKPRALEVGPVTNLPLVALATAIHQLQVNCMGANRGQKKKGGGEKLQQKKKVIVPIYAPKVRQSVAGIRPKLCTMFMIHGKNMTFSRVRLLSPN